MANGLSGYSQQFGALPAVGYPMVDFYGSAGPGTGKSGNGAQATASNLQSALPQVLQQHAIIAVIAIVIGGYALWHISQRI